MRLRKRPQIDQLVLPNEIVARALSDDEVLIVAPELPAWLVLTTAEWRQIKSARSAAGNVLARHSQSVSGSRGTTIDSHTFDKLVAHGLHGSGPKEPDLPRLQFHITNACNLRCPHCYVSSGRPADSELTLSEWIEVLDLYGSPCHVSVSGGEPLTVPWLMELVSHAYQRGHKVALLTNGLLWNASHTSHLLPLLDFVAVSLDGATAGPHENIRGPKTFERTVRTIRSLVSAGASIVLNVTARRSNAANLREHLPALVQTIAPLADVDISNFILEGRGQTNQGEVLPITEFRDLLADIADSLIKSGWRELPVPKRQNCGYGQSLAIYSDGRVSPCLTPRFIRGNIRKDGAKSLKSLIERDRVSSLVDKLPVCSGCYLRYLCGGQCHLTQLRAGFPIAQITCSDQYRDLFILGLEETFRAIEARRTGKATPNNSPELIQIDR